MAIGKCERCGRQDCLRADVTLNGTPIHYCTHCIEQGCGDGSLTAALFECFYCKRRFTKDKIRNFGSGWQCVSCREREFEEYGEDEEDEKEDHDEPEDEGDRKDEQEDDWWERIKQSQEEEEKRKKELKKQRNREYYAENREIIRKQQKERYERKKRERESQ